MPYPDPNRPGDRPEDPNAITPEVVRKLYEIYAPGYQPSDAEIQSHLGHPGGSTALAAMFNQVYGDPAKIGATPPTPPPTNGTNPPAPPIGMGPLTAPFNQPWTGTLPGGTGPTFAPPSYKPPPAFSFADFTAPTPEQALSDPGYQFRLGQGKDALEHSAAARGVLNTGMSLRDILDYGQNAASQEYGNVYNRAANTYGMNRTNALDAYNSQYQTQYTDPYKFAYQGALDTFSGNQRANEFNTSTSLRKWEDDAANFRNWQNDAWAKYFQQAQ